MKRVMKQKRSPNSAKSASCPAWRSSHYLSNRENEMLPDQPNPLDQQDNTAKHNVSRGRRFLTAVCLIVFLAAIAAVLRQQHRPNATAMLDRPNPQIGPKDAPVTIVEFGDYGCSSCLIWADAGMRQQLLDKYGDKVRFVWADFP